MTNPMQAKQRPFRNHQAKHFLFETDADGRVATITLNRPDKKNPLTFESYEELGDLFRALTRASDVRAVVLTGETMWKVRYRKRTWNAGSVWRRCAQNVPSCITCVLHARSAMRRCKSCCTISICWKRC